MLWKEIKSWAKKHGYESSKKDDFYFWYKASDSSVNGESKSVSKLAKAIYNDMTNNKWIDHQNNHGLS